MRSFRHSAYQLCNPVVTTTAGCNPTMPVRPPAHIPAGYQTAAVRRRAFDQQRGSPSRVYGRQWQALRLQKLATMPLCEECPEPVEATIVDHRTPHRGDFRLMYSFSNLRSLCKSCHDRKTATSDGGFGNPVKVAPGQRGR